MSVAPISSRPRSFRVERDFGLWVGAVLAALGGWWTYREKFAAVRPWFLVVGAVLFLLGALWPRALVLPNRAWMALAERIARVVTAVILGLVFYLVVTPIGLYKRLRGWDPLERRHAGPPAGGTSYWRPYTERQRDPKHFDRMY